MRVGIVCPSINPKSFFERTATSIHHIKEIAPYSTFLIHMQGEWNHDDRDVAEGILGAHGFASKFVYTGGFSKPVPMAKIRQRAADLDKDVDYYLSIDDDFKFSPGTKCSGGSSGQRYLEALHFLERYRSCGTVMCRGFFGGSPYGKKIIPRLHYHYKTASGIIWKNMLKSGKDYNLYPEDITALRGGCEETLATYRRIEDGYWAASQHNNPTANKEGDWRNASGDDAVAPQVIADNAGRYIRERYNSPGWYFSAKLKKCPALPLYNLHGGIPEKELHLYVTDYEKEIING